METNRPLQLLKLVTLSLLALPLLAGCTWKLKDPPKGVKVYKYLGSVQCSGGGTSPTEMEQMLTTAAIDVASATCGVDGNMYAAMCGAPDGRIGIFEIAPGDLKAATALGFLPLSGLPDANEAPCR